VVGVEGNSPAFSLLQTLCCFAFRLLFFYLASNVGLSIVAESCLALGFFVQLALGRPLPTWPSRHGHLPAVGGAFLLISHRLWLIASVCKNRLGFPFIKRHGDRTTLSECRIWPWGFPKWVLMRGFPDSLLVAASRDEAAGSLQYAANAGLCYVVCSAVVCCFTASFITFYKA